MNFYRRFIAQYFKITASITDYLRIPKEEKGKKENQFTLNNEAKEAFKQLTQVFEGVSLLAHFDFKAEICIETDASAVIIAGILIQKLPAGTVSTDWKSIAFYSRKLSPVKSQYKTYD